MIVGFFRHGPAEDEEPRPLSKKGRRRTREAAKAIRRLGLGIATVVTSPLDRARESAEILHDVLDLPEPAIDDRLKPGGKLEALLRDRAVLVGHEPDLSKAVQRITGARIRLKKAGFAWVDVDEGTLLLLTSPAES